MVVAAAPVKDYILVEVPVAQPTVAGDKMTTAYFEGGPYHDASMELTETPTVLRLAVPRPVSLKPVTSNLGPPPPLQVAVYILGWAIDYEAHYNYSESIFR